MMFGQQWLFAFPVLLVSRILSVKSIWSTIHFISHLSELWVYKGNTHFFMEILLNSCFPHWTTVLIFTDDILALLFICSVAENYNGPLSFLWKLFAYSIWSHLIPNTTITATLVACIFCTFCKQSFVAIFKQWCMTMHYSNAELSV